jgi:hypothetical protein
MKMKKLNGWIFYLFFALFLCMDFAWSDQEGAFMVSNPPQEFTVFFVGTAKKSTNIIIRWKIQDNRFSASAQLADNSTNALIEPVLRSSSHSIPANPNGGPPPTQFEVRIYKKDLSAAIELKIAVRKRDEANRKYVEEIPVEYNLIYKTHDLQTDLDILVSTVSGSTAAIVSYNPPTTQLGINIVEELQKLPPLQSSNKSTSIKTEDEHK